MELSAAPARLPSRRLPPCPAPSVRPHHRRQRQSSCGPSSRASLWCKGRSAPRFRRGERPFRPGAACGGAGRQRARGAARGDASLANGARAAATARQGGIAGGLRRGAAPARLLRRGAPRPVGPPGRSGGVRPAGAHAASPPLRCKAVTMLGGDEFISSPPRKTVRFGGTLTDILLKYEKVTAALPRRPSRLPAGGCSPSRLRGWPAR